MNIDANKRRDEVAALDWFHAIDFGGYASSGRFKPGKPQNLTLYGAFELMQAMHLRGATTLDLGTADGLVAFGMAALGAERVVATDTHDMPAFRLARRLLGYEDKVEYVPRVQISSLKQHFEPKTFDVIACCGIFYHMLHPQQSFSEVRKFIKDGGYLVLESPYDPDEKRAVLFVNSIECKVNEATTYFVPSRSALIGMANLGGFLVKAIRPLKGPPRLCLLLRAASREELIEDPSVSPFLKQMLKRDLVDDEFRFKVLEAQKKVQSYVALDPLPFEREINAGLEKVTWPHHPSKDVPAFGRTRFETETGNNKVL
jgi:2-polyprenyl-3-methyl-5-hydroxy-6-metoxy-1,4-benzoquinol methylase